MTPYDIASAASPLVQPADADMDHLLAVVGIAVCVGVVALVWLAGALYKALRSPQAPGEQPPSQPGLMAANARLLGLTAICVIFTDIYRKHFDALAVGALWVRLLGLAILVASTVFILWARLSLGFMWSVMPKLQTDHQLHTNGPYAVTRHPIYTGGLGMLLGIALLAGLGQWLIIFLVCLIVLEVKIRIEERLLLTGFPTEYPQYRHQVPQLIPGLRALHRRAPQAPASAS